jgi:hypothetical protein
MKTGPPFRSPHHHGSFSRRRLFGTTAGVALGAALSDVSNASRWQSPRQCPTEPDSRRRITLRRVDPSVPDRRIVEGTKHDGLSNSQAVWHCDDDCCP